MTVGLDAGKKLPKKAHTPKTELLIARAVETAPGW